MVHSIRDLQTSAIRFSSARYALHTPAQLRVYGSPSGFLTWFILPVSGLLTGFILPVPGFLTWSIPPVVSLVIWFITQVFGPLSGFIPPGFGRLPPRFGLPIYPSCLCTLQWLVDAASLGVEAILVLLEFLGVVVAVPLKAITPLASASPSSPPSDHSRPSLNSSFQTTRFKFRSRLNKPLISATITVIFSEEEDELMSSDDTSRAQSQSQDMSDFQGDMAGVVLNDTSMQHEDGLQEDPQPQPASPQEQILACEPAHLSGSVLNLVIPPEGSMMGAEDNEMVTWIGSPNQANVDATGSPPQV